MSRNNSVVTYIGDQVDGICHGTGRSYDKSGNVVYDGQWQHGEPHGVGKWYFSNGKLRYEGDVQHSKPNGEGDLYYRWGTLRFHGQFEDGQPNGFGLEYWWNGNIKYNGEWRYGKKYNLGRYYNESGAMVVSYQQLECFRAEEESASRALRQTSSFYVNHHQSSIGNVNHEEIRALSCPITLEVMDDPVIDREGNTYERIAIEEWIRAHGASPITRSRLSVSELTPNRIVKDIIDRLPATTVVTRGLDQSQGVPNGAANDPG